MLIRYNIYPGKFKHNIASIYNIIDNVLEFKFNYWSIIQFTLILNPITQTIGSFKRKCSITLQVFQTEKTNFALASSLSLYLQ